MKVDKCGVPPVLNPKPCAGVEFKYFYKVWPWAPLDDLYFDREGILDEYDAFVFLNGKWYEYWEEQHFGPINIAKNLDRYLKKLRKVFKGPIIFMNEYGYHDSNNEEEGVSDPVDCKFGQDPDLGKKTRPCSYTSIGERPDHVRTLQKWAKRRKIPYIDRWKISDDLPHEYFKIWYCDKEFHHEWFCDHHLHFVGLQNIQMVANILTRLLPERWR